MKSDYIQTKFSKNGIEIILPMEEDIKFIGQFRKDVYMGIQTEEQI